MSQSTRRNTSQAATRVERRPADAEALMEQTRASSRRLAEAVLECARERPGATILWSLGIGFVLGWRLKPW